MSADVTIESIASTLADERRELRAVLAPLADLPAVLRELARAVAAPVPPEQDLRYEGLPEFMRAHRERAASAALLDLCDDLGLDRHRRLSDGSKVEDLPAVELRHEIVAMLRASANTDAAQESLVTIRQVLDVSSDAGWMGRTVVACKDAVAASWEQKERADSAEHALERVRSSLRGALDQLKVQTWFHEDDVESLVTQLLLACSLARHDAYMPVARSLGLSVSLEGLDSGDARAALVQAIRDRALADRQADVIAGQDGVIDAVVAALGVPGRADGETATDWAARVAAQIGERAAHAGISDGATVLACETLTMERDDARAQLRATDAVLRRALQAAEIELENLTTGEMAQLLAEIAVIRERTLEEADASSSADMDAIAAARDTIAQLDRTLRLALQNAGESTDDVTVLDLAERLAARATDIPRSARDGARREQREIIAALALDVRIDHLSVPGARAEIIRAVQSTTDAAGDRAAEQLRDVARALRAVTPDLPEHVSVVELAHDVAERARRATDGTPDYKRPIEEARRTDDGAIWAVWSACQSLSVELAEDATIREACDALGARMDSLAVWTKESLPLVRLWDRQLVELCPLDVPALDKSRDNAATLGATDDDEENWKELADDARAVADGDDIDGLVSWIDVTKDARAVLGALLDRVSHLEDKLQDKDDVDPRSETPLAEKLAQRMFEHWPAVEITTIQRSLDDLARVDDPLVRGVCALLTDKVQRAQRRRDLEDWCALAPNERNRLIDRTQEALDAVA